MELTNQTQKAGDYSTQIINYNYGISEERVRAIYKEECREVMRSMAAEARTTAEARIIRLEDYVIARFKEIDHSFESFADPSILHTVRKAQISAAISDKDSDFDTLAELLSARIADKEADRSRSLYISKAIEIVPEISAEALAGLSAVYAITFMYPTEEGFEGRMDGFEKMFADIIGSATLPQGVRWIEDLDLLRLIRLNPLNYGAFKKMKEYLPFRFGSVMVEGKDSSDPYWHEISEKMDALGLPSDIFIDHPLRNGYKICKYNIEDIDTLILVQHNGTEKTESPLSEPQKVLLKNIISNLNREAMENDEIKRRLLEKWKSYPTLLQITDWWESIPRNFQLTSVGKALANASIRLKYPELPRDW